MAEWAVLLSLLIFAMSMGGLGILQIRPLRELGKLSFSVYIVHFAVLRFIVEPLVSTWGHAQWLFPAMFLLTVLLSYWAASLLYNLVERPGQKIGRHLIEWRSARGNTQLRLPK